MISSPSFASGSTECAAPEESRRASTEPITPRGMFLKAALPRRAEHVVKRVHLEYKKRVVSWLPMSLSRGN